MTVLEEKRLRGTNNNNTTQRACWLVLFSSPKASALGPPRGLSASLPPSATHPADRPLLQFATENTGERELGTKDVNKQTAEPADETHTQRPGGVGPGPRLCGELGKYRARRPRTPSHGCGHELAARKKCAGSQEKRDKVAGETRSGFHVTAWCLSPSSLQVTALQR